MSGGHEGRLHTITRACVRVLLYFQVCTFSIFANSQSVCVSSLGWKGFSPAGLLNVLAGRALPWLRQRVGEGQAAHGAAGPASGGRGRGRESPVGTATPAGELAQSLPRCTGRADTGRRGRRETESRGVCTLAERALPAASVGSGVCAALAGTAGPGPCWGRTWTGVVWFGPVSLVLPHFLHSCRHFVSIYILYIIIPYAKQLYIPIGS